MADRPTSTSALDAAPRRAREVLAAAPGVAEVLGPEKFAELGLPHPAEDPTQGDLVLHAAEGWYCTSRRDAGARG